MEELKTQITCFGAGEGTPGGPYYKAMEEVGRLLAKMGITVVVGDHGGSMEAVIKGAFLSEMEAVTKGTFLSGGKITSYVTQGAVVSKDYAFLVYECGDFFMSPEEKMAARLGKLLNSDSFILDASGGTETVCELMAFVTLSKKTWRGEKKLAILFLEAGKTNNILIEMVNMLSCSSFISEEVKKSIKICFSPEEAVAFAVS